MRKHLTANGLCQEHLKLIACITMLIDHIGHIFFPNINIFRIIGRMAFPIYCFLLVEGAHHTSNPKKYACRMLISAIISEIAFDLAFSGHTDWSSQNVMWTLLIGFVMIIVCSRLDGTRKIIAMIPFIGLAEIIQSDYSGMGVALIAMFYLIRSLPIRWYALPIIVMTLFNTAQIFALSSLIPISRYNGEKQTHNAVIQWMFYLFYPMHLFILYLIYTFINA